MAQAIRRVTRTHLAVKCQQRPSVYPCVEIEGARVKYDKPSLALVRYFQNIAAEIRAGRIT